MEIIENRLSSSDLIVFPVGDFQIGNPACSLNYVKRYLDWTISISSKLETERRFIGTGDYMDFMSPSNREKYRSSGLYSSTTRLIQETTVLPLAEKVYEILGPTLSGETVALCQGHHWMNLEGEGLGDAEGKRHFHTDKWLAAMLGARFVESAVLVKFIFPSGRVYRVHATHGQGNGQSLTYGLNKLDRQASSWEAVDAFAMGHTHKAGIAASTRIREEDGKLVSRQVPLITCGGFLKAYLEGDTSYAEEKQLSSLALGATALRLTEIDESNDGLLIQPMMLI